MPDSFKLRLKKLVLPKKFVLIGSALAALSVFLPWYQDIDKFNTGDMFLGISGPTYLAGIIVLVACASSLGIILAKLLNRPAPKLPVSENLFHIFTSSISILMLVFALSVYFHPKFGINLTDKSSGIGVILASIGVGFVMLGAIMSLRSKNDVDFEVETGNSSPLIDFEREKADLDAPLPSVGRPPVQPLRTPQEAMREDDVYDHGRMAIKNAVSDSIDEGLDRSQTIEEALNSTNDIK